MDESQAAYRSYLLRLRRVDNAGQPIWRVSLEEPGSREQIYFDTFAALCDYLAAQMKLGEGRGGGVDEVERG